MVSFWSIDFSSLSLQPENVQPKDEYSATGMSSASTSTVSSGGIDVDGPVGTVQHPASMSTAGVSSAGIDIDNSGAIQHPSQYTLPSSQTVSGKPHLRVLSRNLLYR